MQSFIRLLGFNMKDNENVPEYLQSTIDMIVKSYPNGIPKDDYYPLIKIMKNCDMSDRSVAHVIAILKKGKYRDYLYDVAHIMPNTVITQAQMDSVVKRLSPNGYEAWLKEE